MNFCWICGSNNNLSKEHKFKSNWIKNKLISDDLLHFKGKNEGKKINSEKDKKLTHGNIICTSCNNVLSQPYDKAFDIFLNYFEIENIQNIIDSKIINYQKIYGANWLRDKKNLYKYFAKQIGCLINSGKVPFDIDIHDISRFILYDINTSNLNFIFEVNELINELQIVNKNYFHYFLGPTIYIGVNEFIGSFSNSYIKIHWIYSNNCKRNLLENDSIEFCQLKLYNDFKSEIPLHKNNKYYIELFEYLGIENIEKHKKWIFDKLSI